MWEWNFVLFSSGCRDERKQGFMVFSWCGQCQENVFPAEMFRSFGICTTSLFLGTLWGVYKGQFQKRSERTKRKKEIVNMVNIKEY